MEHVEKTAAEAEAKALEEKHVDGLGFDAPGVNKSTGSQCKAWITSFMLENMKQNPDGQWIFLVEGVTLDTITKIHTRVQHWKRRPGSDSYQKCYNDLIAALNNAARKYSAQC